MEVQFSDIHQNVETLFPGLFQIDAENFLERYPFQNGTQGCIGHLLPDTFDEMDSRHSESLIRQPQDSPLPEVQIDAKPEPTADLESQPVNTEECDSCDAKSVASKEAKPRISNDQDEDYVAGKADEDDDEFQYREPRRKEK